MRTGRLRRSVSTTLLALWILVFPVVESASATTVLYRRWYTNDWHWYPGPYYSQVHDAHEYDGTDLSNFYLKTQRWNGHAYVTSVYMSAYAMATALTWWQQPISGRANCMRYAQGDFEHLIKLDCGTVL